MSLQNVINTDVKEFFQSLDDEERLLLTQTLPTEDRVKFEGLVKIISEYSGKLIELRLRMQNRAEQLHISLQDYRIALHSLFDNVEDIFDDLEEDIDFSDSDIFIPVYS